MNVIPLYTAGTILLLAMTNNSSAQSSLTGAWKMNQGSQEEILLFIDGYFTHTAYDQQNKKFIHTRGGHYKQENEKLSVEYEFDTRDKEQVGQALSYAAGVKDGNLETNINGATQTWSRIDEGNNNLAGLWKITGRMQNGDMVQIHQTGTRKTVKILSGTRFQWAAIDPGTKQFMGTGGGHYSFETGKYTENIEFFSRDDSRVGQSLGFEGELKNGDWHHRGLSSRGEPIYEIWSRNKN